MPHALAPTIFRNIFPKEEALQHSRKPHTQPAPRIKKTLFLFAYAFVLYLAQYMRPVCCVCKVEERRRAAAGVCALPVLNIEVHIELVLLLLLLLWKIRMRLVQRRSHNLYCTEHANTLIAFNGFEESQKRKMLLFLQLS